LTGVALILKAMLKNRAVDRVFHALAEPTRRAIVERLSVGPMSVSDLAKPFEMTLAAIVQHLQVLEQGGVVRTEKVGRVRTCCVDSDGLRLAERWISERRTLWERRFDRLGQLLAEDENQSRPPPPRKKRKRP
jgi:DNA-binding transcriptional ArsR family regulator